MVEKEKGHAGSQQIYRHTTDRQQTNKPPRGRLPNTHACTHADTQTDIHTGMDRCIQTHRHSYIQRRRYGQMHAGAQAWTDACAQIQ